MQGCMKSGPVNTDATLKYYEPESWRFGESPYSNGAAFNYPRHASGQVRGWCVSACFMLDPTTPIASASLDDILENILYIS